MVRLDAIQPNLLRAMCMSCLLASLFVALFSYPAAAHGPCGAQGSSCLEPKEGPPRTEVTTEGFEGILAVWNPRPNILALGIPGSSKDCDIKCAAAKSIYHVDQLTAVVAETDDRSELQFVVPDVPPGEYLIVMYDGSEGGRHYTWDTFRVTGAASPVVVDPAEGEPAQWARASLLGGMVVIGGVAGWSLGRRKSTRLT